MEKSKKINRAYGLNKGLDGEWKFGNHNLEINNDEIKIGSKSWKYKEAGSL